MSLSNKRRLLLVVGVSVTLLVLAIIGVLISIKGRTEASTPPPLSSGVRTFSPAPGLAGSNMNDSLCEYPHLKLGRLLNLLILLITDFYLSHRTGRSFHRT